MSKNAPRTLLEITKDLGDAYKRWKSGEKDKEARRKEFFAEATKEAAAGTLAQKTVQVAEGVETEEEARAWVGRQYPTWNVIDFDFDEDEEVLLALLEENPEYIERVFINPEDGTVYTKNVTSGSPYLDEEQLQAENPELWERISEEPPPPPPPPRRLLPSEKIDPDDLALMEKYMYPPQPQVKLLAPRKVKDEELEALNG